jgi:hypothetical protein
METTTIGDSIAKAAPERDAGAVLITDRLSLIAKMMAVREGFEPSVLPHALLPNDSPS